MNEKNGKKREIRSGIGMAVSGGGFRATLFHLGSFWRLNELGQLPNIKRICSVSGGSIISAHLGLQWKNLNFDANNIATNFEELIANPIQDFCKLDIDVSSILGGWLSIFKRPSDIVANRYKENLFGEATLQDFPKDKDGPRFIIYATNLQTGVSVRFSKPYLADYRIGLINNPSTPLAVAVAASSAFPPVLTPVVLEMKRNSWRKVEGADLFNNTDLRREMILADGGVYDNLGLEAIDNFESVWVSDAGAPLAITPKSWILKISQIKKMLRVLDITVEQTRALRKRQLIDNYKLSYSTKGAYWGIATQIDKYKLSNAMVSDNQKTRAMQNIRTRLNSFSAQEQGQLINWGYALTDTAIRRHVMSSDSSPGKWPIPKYSL